VCIGVRARGASEPAWHGRRPQEAGASRRNVPLLWEAGASRRRARSVQRLCVAAGTFPIEAEERRDKLTYSPSFPIEAEERRGKLTYSSTFPLEAAERRAKLTYSPTFHLRPRSAVLNSLTHPLPFEAEERRAKLTHARTFHSRPRSIEPNSGTSAVSSNTSSIMLSPSVESPSITSRRCRRHALSRRPWPEYQPKSCRPGHRRSRLHGTVPPESCRRGA
jgi:hypothetical protein